MIPFNKPYLSGKETKYIEEAVRSGKISGNGGFTKKCQAFFEKKYAFKKCLLTTSCTDALEMAAILLDIAPGDEVILPSYTFVSTANAFVLRGAKLVFADSREDHPGINEASIEALVTTNTKAIVVVHYAGVACDMDVIMGIASRHNLFVVEDAAQAIDSYYKGKPLGGIGHLSAFSFHETKNIIAGEGGMLVINDERFVDRAEVIWEKGTNRSAFFRGEVDKYGWVDIGSSFLPSEVIAAFLYAQLEQLDDIQRKRKYIWDYYFNRLINVVEKLEVQLPAIPEFASNNAHMFYLVANNITIRESLLSRMREREVYPVFHYLSLHKSPFYNTKHDGRILDNSDHYTDCLFRLPLFYELDDQTLSQVVEAIS
ncbi:dTDP-4-amino-4,6-dideoxygalactose transaminase [Roseivirga spongicola]|uniref:dTDP-4-amino-4,6-dideoxygalactose transaminase n=1 Tax=Roseivirga spongicola TaxID=333140 RepID=UPI002AC9ECEF|nr:dTDP-4-amino-4,6-dideoxygalactose transaminase [Roseivirga spongicola]WPZ09166.1 dTDP-4-amino-4,6-dideoxygalactose transaminase [Roseivirga spongicola]